MFLNIRYKNKDNPAQRAFHEDLLSKFLHLSGGFGSGKTYALVQKLIQLSMLNRPHPGGCLAQSYPDLKKDVVPTFEQILEENNLRYKFNKTDFIFRFPWTRGPLYLFSAEKPLRGPNLAYMGINEATLIARRRYMEAVGRVRLKGAKHPQIASGGTPEGIGNYIYEQFVEKPMNNSRIIYGDTRDNIANLDPTYIESLESSYDKIMLDAYLKGLWVNMNGNQFYYAYDPHKNEDKTIKERLDMEVECFMDFNVEHMTATLWHYYGSSLEGFGEIVLENNADTNKMCIALKERGYLPGRTKIYPDPAGKNRSTNGAPDHTILRQHGFEVVARLAAPKFRERQLAVNNSLDKAIIKFNPITMPALRRDLQAVEQDPVTLEKIKKNPKLTHASDGLDYGHDILFPLSGKKPRSGNVTYR